MTYSRGLCPWDGEEHVYSWHNNLERYGWIKVCTKCGRMEEEG